MIDLAALQMALCVLTGWLDRREREAVAYLIEENRLLRLRRAVATTTVDAPSPFRRNNSLVEVDRNRTRRSKAVTIPAATRWTFW